MTREEYVKLKEFYGVSDADRPEAARPIVREG